MKTILVDAIGTFVLPEGGIFEPLHALLESYPNEKIVLTNATAQERASFGLDALPYRVFSLDHDPDKTDPVYFRLMLQQYGLQSTEVVYFEHNPEAVRSAESIGIVTYSYDSKTKEIGALKAFLDRELTG